jgi:2-polyprenyl-3-methyl-5-hydroxy-6-metoxy-1,4-benzoquinol methylase
MQYMWNVDIGYLGSTDHMQIVEIGCADGLLAVELAGLGFTIIGVEPEAYLREQFERNAALSGLTDNCTVIAAEVEHLPFASGTVPAIIMTEVLEHLQEPSAALREIARVLTPGGRVCLSVPTKLTETIFSALHPRYVHNATHLQRFSRRDIALLAQQAGLRLDRVEGRNFRPSLEWLVHSMLRTRSDHAGRLHEHLWVQRGSERMWRLLARAGLASRIEAAGNRVFPKSWYFYLGKPERP